MTEEREPLQPRTAARYLPCLHTYLLSLAIAGVSQQPGATALHAETQASDSTDYISAPWDILLAYHQRCEQNSEHLPEATRARWIEDADVAKRTIWVKEYRESTLSFGTIVNANFYKRAACW